VLRTVAALFYPEFRRAETAGSGRNATHISALGRVAIEEDREDRAYHHGDKEKEGQRQEKARGRSRHATNAGGSATREAQNKSEEREAHIAGNVEAAPSRRQWQGNEGRAARDGQGNQQAEIRGERSNDSG
jgi:hypothetical protein